MEESVVFVFRTLFTMFLDMADGIISFSMMSIGDLCRSLLFGFVPQVLPSLENVTVLQAMFGFGVPVVLTYAIVAWIVDVLP